MKNAVGRIIFVLVIGAVIYWLISSNISQRSQNTEKRKLETEKRLQTKKHVEGMVTKYNAIADWKRGLESGSSLLKPAFTIEVHEALVREDDKPILFFAAIEDITKETDNYTVHFHNQSNAFTGADIHFVLNCTHQEVKEINLDSRRLFDNYAVVAHITNVTKIKYGALTADEYTSVSVSSSFPSNVFEATGSCLDLLFVGDYELSDFQETSSK